MFELKPKYQPGTIAAHGSVVVIAEVRGIFCLKFFLNFMVDSNIYFILFYFILFYSIWQDRKIHLNEWDGKTLKEIVVLEGNQNNISSLAFSPDGKLLASGDVSFF